MIRCVVVEQIVNNTEVKPMKLLQPHHVAGAQIILQDRQQEFCSH